MLKFLYINRIKLYYYILIFIGVYGFFLNVSLGDMDFKFNNCFKYYFWLLGVI